jgi:hypothetical protein
MRRPTDIQGSLLMLVCIGECRKADTLHSWLGGSWGWMLGCGSGLLALLAHNNAFLVWFIGRVNASSFGRAVGCFDFCFRMSKVAKRKCDSPLDPIEVIMNTVR